MQLDVTRRASRDVRCGRLVPEDLLDRVGDPGGIRDERSTLVGVIREQLARPADQAVRGLVSRGGQEVDVDQHLVAGERPHRAGLVLELGVDQFRHEVVGGVLAAPVDVPGELLAGDRLHRVVAWLAGLGAEVGIAPAAYPFLVRLGNPEEHPDHPHRHLRPEVGDEVDLVGARQAVERRRAEAADLRFERVHPLGREHA